MLAEIGIGVGIGIGGIGDMEVTNLVFAGAVALAAGCLAWLLLSGVLDLGWQFWRSRRATFVRWQDAFLQPVAKPEERGNLAFLLLGWAASAYLLIYLPIIGLYFAVVTYVAHRYLQSRRRAQQDGLLAGEIERLITAFLSYFSVTSSLWTALRDAAQKMRPPWHAVVGNAAEAGLSGVAAQEVFAKLQDTLPHAFLRDFVFILERMPKTTRESILQALKELTARIRLRQRLRARVGTTLALLKGTTRILQAANVGAILLTVSSPIHREFYTGSLDRQVIFVIAVTMALVASFFLEWRILMLEERTL